MLLKSFTSKPGAWSQSYMKMLCATTERTVVSVVETWLSEEISGAEVSTPDYSVIRHRHEGDIAIHVQNNDCNVIVTLITDRVV